MGCSLKNRGLVFWGGLKRIVHTKKKYVVPKRELHEILCHSHSAIAHRGRDKLENYIKNNYAEIPQIVVKLFVSLCSIHEQQKIRCRPSEETSGTPHHRK